MEYASGVNTQSGWLRGQLAFAAKCAGAGVAAAAALALKAGSQQRGRRPLPSPEVDGALAAAADPLPVRVDGAGFVTLFFVHGWPDDESLWDAQVAHFRGQYRCVRVTMPHFAGRPAARDLGHDQKPWGFDFSEGGDLLAATIRREAAESAARGGDGAVTLVLHDWGVLWGLCARRACPELVRAVVVMDVGPPSTFGNGWRALPFVVLAGVMYQYWLLLAYALAQSTGGTPLAGLCRPLADRMARAAAAFFVPPGGPAQGQRVTADTCYPYYYYQTDWGVRGIPLSEEVEPSCPCLFFYGARKPVHFHSSAWARRLAARPGSRVVPVPAGHWLQVQRPALVNAEMDAWLAANSAPPPTGPLPAYVSAISSL